MSFIKISRFVFLMLLIAFFVMIPLATFGQQTNDKLAQQVEKFDSANPTLSGQLIELGQQFQIPMGIELFISSDKHVASPIHMNNATVQEIMKKILEQQPNIHVELNNGLVHIFNDSLINDSKNFLNLKISEFSLKDASLLRASYYLSNCIIEEIDPGEGLAGGSGYGTPRTDGFDINKISFSGNNLPVRQILNQMVAAQGNALWVVYLHPIKKIVNGRFYASIPIVKDKSLSYPHWQFIPFVEEGQAK